jgi:ATP-dependent helicase HepA
MLISKGQRYISDAEPELGLGVITNVDVRYVDVRFASANTQRRFSRASAPLRRIKFKPGDMICDMAGVRLRIASISESADTGLITYFCGEAGLREDSVGDAVNLSAPLDRLFHGKIDPSAEFDVRIAMHRFRADTIQSDIWGFTGGRIECLPHQLYIAKAVSSRRVPRALLADETGLGKTIEACLIVHRLLVCGRISRVLVLVPEHLMHQWFVELLRRFNLSFTLCTEEFVKSSSSDVNPVKNEQLCIAGINDISKNNDMNNMVTGADWDMVIVDEAHHIRRDTPGFALIEQLAGNTPGFLLLTATPEQFGRYDHFVLLKLLDPLRYRNFSDYENEQASLKALYSHIDAELCKSGINVSEISQESASVDIPDSLLFAAIKKSRPKNSIDRVRSWPVEQLIDICGTGSMMFRNTRRTITGFPSRKVHIVPLAAEQDIIEQACREMQNDCLDVPGQNVFFGTLEDPRVEWLCKFAAENKNEKILVICRTMEKAIRIHNVIGKSIKVDAGLFHEEMTILQRDRNAAWFGEENGAVMLICSEMGSEGRNFQFCHSLVLFDLPINPELLEQRIGRLDRIGQKGDIHLYVPFIKGTGQEILCRWYHEGLNAFLEHVPAAGRVFEKQASELTAFCTDMSKAADLPGAQKFIENTRALCREFSADFTDPRDKMLGVTSFQRASALLLVQKMNDLKTTADTEMVMTGLLNMYGIIMEDAGKNKYALITELLSDNAFPLPRSERPVITFNRETALFREDVEFITPDHPMLTGSLDLFLSSERGTSSFCTADTLEHTGLILESVYILECAAPSYLNVDNFPAPAPFRVVVDRNGIDITEQYPEVKMKSFRLNTSTVEFNAQLRQVIQKMMEKSNDAAAVKAQKTISALMKSMRNRYEKEISRIRELELKYSVTNEGELDNLKNEIAETEKYLGASHARLDAARLIKCCI